MNLINYGQNLDNQDKFFLNVDFIKCICKQKGKYKVWMIGSEEEYEISESAYNTILNYGKANI